jgi:hypothetical protein
MARETGSISSASILSQNIGRRMTGERVRRFSVHSQGCWFCAFCCSRLGLADAVAGEWIVCVRNSQVVSEA